MNKKLNYFHHFIIVFIIFILSACEDANFCMVGNDYSSDNSKQGMVTIQKNIEINANDNQWYNTGIRVSQDERIEIQSSGNVTLAQSLPRGREGLSRKTGELINYLDNKNTEEFDYVRGQMFIIDADQLYLDTGLVVTPSDAISIAIGQVSESFNDQDGHPLDNKFVAVTRDRVFGRKNYREWLDKEERFILSAMPDRLFTRSKKIDGNSVQKECSRQDRSENKTIQTSISKKEDEILSLEKTIGSLDNTRPEYQTQKDKLTKKVEELDALYIQAEQYEHCQESTTTEKPASSPSVSYNTKKRAIHDILDITDVNAIYIDNYITQLQNLVQKKTQENATSQDNARSKRAQGLLDKLSLKIRQSQPSLNDLRKIIENYDQEQNPKWINDNKDHYDYSNNDDNKRATKHLKEIQLNLKRQDPYRERKWGWFRHHCCQRGVAYIAHGIGRRPCDADRVTSYPDFPKAFATYIDDCPHFVPSLSTYTNGENVYACFYPNDAPYPKIDFSQCIDSVHFSDNSFSDTYVNSVTGRDEIGVKTANKSGRLLLYFNPYQDNAAISHYIRSKGGGGSLAGGIGSAAAYVKIYKGFFTAPEKLIFAISDGVPSSATESFNGKEIYTSQPGILWVKLHDDYDNDYTNNLGSYEIKITAKTEDKNQINNIGQIFKTIYEYFRNIFTTILMGKDGIIKQITGLDSPLQSTVHAMLTLYIIFYGLGFLMGVVEANQHDLVIRLFKIGVIATLFSDNGYHFFNDYVFDFWINLATFLSTAVSGTNDIFNMFSFLDGPVKIFTSWVTWPTLLSMLILPAGIGVFVLTVICHSMVTYMLVLLQVGVSLIFTIIIISFLLALAPICITCMLFSSTRHIFDNWISVLARFSFETPLLILVVNLFNTLTFNALIKIFSKSICFKCAFPITIPFIKLDLFCIPWIVPWGMDPALSQSPWLFIVPIWDIIQLVIFTKILETFAGGQILTTMLNTLFGVSQIRDLSVISMAKTVTESLKNTALSATGMDVASKERRAKKRAGQGKGGGGKDGGGKDGGGKDDTKVQR